MSLNSSQNIPGWPLARPSDRESLRATLELLPMLAQLPPESLDLCLQFVRLRHVSDGEIVTRRGEAQPGVGIVHQGEIDLVMTGRSGRRYLCGVLRRGQAFGEVPALDGGPAVLTSIARGDSSVLLIPRDLVLEALAMNARAAVALLVNLARRTRFLIDLLGNQITLPLEGRVANMLLVVMQFQEQDGALESPADINLSQTDLADILGVTRQALGPVLKTLEASGAIALQYRYIRVLDPAKLQALVAEAAAVTIAAP